MRQQINLLSKANTANRSVIYAAASIAFAVVGLLGVGLWNRSQIQNAQAEQAALAALIQTAQAELKAARSLAGLPDPEAMNQRMVELKAKITQNSGLLAQIEKGELGTQAGHSPLLNMLATQTQPGVWLTGIESSGPNDLALLTGRAINAEAVMKYTQRLNRMLSNKGINGQLGSIEMQSQDISNTAPSKIDNKPTRVIDFKLSK
jgi:Tfp pilus assembly protein PilN